MKCMRVFNYAAVIVESACDRSILLLQWQEMYKYTSCAGYVLVNSCLDIKLTFLFL